MSVTRIIVVTVTKTCIVFISCSSYNKYNKLDVLKQQKFFSFRVLEAREQTLVSVSLNADASRAILTLKALGEKHFFTSCSFWWLLASLGLWPSHSDLPLRSRYLLLFGLGLCSNISCNLSPHGIFYRTWQIVSKINLENNINLFHD